MGNNEFPEFVSIEYKDKVALIDPKNKVCLKVSKRIADNIENQDVRDKNIANLETSSKFAKRNGRKEGKN